MKTSNQGYITIKHPKKWFETIDVVPLRRSEENNNKLVGAVLTPGAGISRVEFSRNDIVDNSQTVSK